MKFNNKDELIIKPHELKEMFRTPEKFVKGMKKIHDLYGLPYDETEELKKLYEYIENRNAGGV